MSSLITYKIVSDEKGKVKKAARTACNFWNRFVDPRTSVVIRLGVFTEDSGTIACSYEPHAGPSGVIYGRVDFNRKYLATYSYVRIVGAIIHEIGHTLGFGWSTWMKLFDTTTGKFKPKAVRTLPALQMMLVETDGGPGTEYSHWDEERFDKEMMTGYEDRAEHVLPVTIDVMELLGHRVKSRIAKKSKLGSLIKQAAAVKFTRKTEAKKLDLDHFRETPIWERVPHSIAN